MERRGRLSLAAKTLVSMLIAGATAFVINLASAAAWPGTDGAALWIAALVAVLLILGEFLIGQFVPSQEEVELSIYRDATLRPVENEIEIADAVAKEMVAKAKAGDLEGFDAWRKQREKLP